MTKQPDFDKLIADQILPHMGVGGFLKSLGSAASGLLGDLVGQLSGSQTEDLKRKHAKGKVRQAGSIKRPQARPGARPGRGESHGQMEERVTTTLPKKFRKITPRAREAFAEIEGEYGSTPGYSTDPKVQTGLRPKKKR